MQCRLILMLLFTTLTKNVLGQHRFAFTKNVSDVADVATKIIETNDSYIACGIGLIVHKNLLYDQGVILKINKNNYSQNQIVSIKPLPDSTFSNILNKMIRIDNGYLLAGFSTDTINRSIDRSRIVLVWLDNNFEEVNRKYIGNVGENYFLNDIKKMANDDYLITGSLKATDPYGQAFLARLDVAGNIIWQTTYGQIGREEILMELDIINNTVFISGAFRTDNWPNPYIKSFLYKYNLQGVQTGFKEYQNRIDRDYNYPWSFSYDGTNLYLCGATGNNTRDSTYFNIIKVDTMLNTIWEKELPSLKQYNTLSFASLWDNARQQLMVTSGYHYSDHATGVIATDTAGNIRWQQEYYTRTDAPQYLYDIQKTSDGGYIMCGSAIPNTPNPTQDFWVIKTDSVGCVVHCITGVDNSPTAEAQPEIQVFPNPINDVLHIIAPENIRTISIYNAQGQVMYQQVVTLENNHVLITIPHYPSGIYLIEIEDEKKQKYNKKILKQ